MTGTARVRAARWSVLLAVCLGGWLAGCGSQTSSADDDPPTPTPDRPQAVQVRVESSGGFAGIANSVVVRAGDPGAADILEQAAAFAAAAPDIDKAETPPPCCDLTSYKVTINLDDGSTVETMTYDGDNSLAHDLVLAVLAELTPTPGIPPDPR